MDHAAQVWFVVMVAVLLLLLVLVACDPLFRTEAGSPERWSAVGMWLFFALVAPLTMYLKGVESLVEIPQFITVFTSGLLMFTLGRPAVVMDQLFEDHAKFPSWTTALKWRGRAAILLSTGMTVGIFVALDA